MAAESTGFHRSRLRLRSRCFNASTPTPTPIARPISACFEWMALCSSYVGTRNSAMLGTISDKAASTCGWDSWVGGGGGGIWWGVHWRRGAYRLLAAGFGYRSVPCVFVLECLTPASRVYIVWCTLCDCAQKGLAHLACCASSMPSPYQQPELTRDRPLARLQDRSRILDVYLSLTCFVME